MLCSCWLLHGMWWSRHCSPHHGQVGTGWEVFGVTSSGALRTQEWAHTLVYAQTPSPRWGGNTQTPSPRRPENPQPGCYPGDSRHLATASPPYWETPQRGQDFCVFMRYLEHLLILTVHSTWNRDQPGSRQNLKHRSALSSMCQVILPHFSGQVWQSKDHPHHKDSIASSFQGYSAPAAPITFSYSYQC